MMLAMAKLRKSVFPYSNTLRTLPFFPTTILLVPGTYPCIRANVVRKYETNKKRMLKNSSIIRFLDWFVGNFVSSLFRSK